MCQKEFVFLSHTREGTIRIRDMHDVSFPDEIYPLQIDDDLMKKNVVNMSAQVCNNETIKEEYVLIVACQGGIWAIDMQSSISRHILSGVLHFTPDMTLSLYMQFTVQ